MQCTAWTLVTSSILGLASVLFIASILTPAWRISYHSEDDTQIVEGLWQKCIIKTTIYTTKIKTTTTTTTTRGPTSTTLQPNTTLPDVHCIFYTDMPGFLQTARIFECVALLLFILTWVLLLLHTVCKSQTNRHIALVKINIALCLLTAFVIFIAVCAVSAAHQKTLGYSLYLSVFSLLFMILAAITRVPDAMSNHDQPQEDKWDSTYPEKYPSDPNMADVSAPQHNDSKNTV